MGALGEAARLDRARRTERERTYICIDLKTFYASVECVERGLDPFTQPLVVADMSRGRSTICLAVSPAMKALGVRNRCRVFDIPGNIDYIAAKPRMRHYMEMSARIYGIYLEYVSPIDIHVYSIDECFIDATPYLALYGLSAREFAEELRRAVLARTGITATAGIGPNLFLCKVALDITAKHEPSGIGELDEERFRREVWRHRPITDIWGIGPGIAERLAKYRVYDLMGVAALDERILYREFGVNAEYLIDHAHGVEPCTIAEIQAYRPQATSITNGQVLARNYSSQEALTVLREMVEASSLDLVRQHLVASSISLFVGYGSEARELRRLDVSGSASYVDGCGHRRSSTAEDIQRATTRPGARTAGIGTGGASGMAVSGTHADPGAVRDLLGDSPRAREMFVGEHGKQPRGGKRGYAHAGKQRKLSERTNSRKKLLSAFEELFCESVDPRRPIKRVNIGFGNLLPEEFATVNLFTDVEAEAREQELQRAIIDVKGKYGKNALVMGRSLRPEATARERNEQVGGHRA
ncbi:MAG: DNA repair protein [Coriobacteriaceae bacterium]|nr:DNA repair protein [Coriobacteriaceae bacterium]